VHGAAGLLPKRGSVILLALSKNNQGEKTMEAENLYQQLAEKIGTPSKRIEELWKVLCDEGEARLLLAMPGTVEQLAEKTGRTPEHTKPMLDLLFRKGVVFDREKEGVVTFSMAKHLLQFHDATILWPEAPEGFLDQWQEFMDEEYPAIAQALASMDLPAFTRVIPVEAPMEGGGSQILPFENALKIVEEARSLAVTACTCRLTAKKCESPVEVCLQLNRAAEYAIKRGTGREVTKEEAKEIVRKSEESGLVHVTDNRADNEHIICNCCSCCCIVLPLILKERKRVLLAPSRFLPEVDADKCTLCQTCMEACPVDALSLNGGGAEEEVVVEQDLCIGCGQCAYQCPEEAMTLKEVRNPGFVPGAAS
jgi:formate hydrogenlyase subunit 6/NADH:ubiquinone oxidoreductase subunit I